MNDRPKCKPCLQCGKTMWRDSHRPWSVWEERKFCSKECVYAHRRATIPGEVRTHVKQCLRCGVEYTRRKTETTSRWRERKYCGPECSRKALVPANKKTYWPRTCEGCGQTYSKNPKESGTAYNRRKYCGRECSAAVARVKSTEAIKEKWKDHTPKPRRKTYARRPKPVKVFPDSKPDQEVWRPPGWKKDNA